MRTNFTEPATPALPPASHRGIHRMALTLSHGGTWCPDFDVRCQHRHKLQMFVPVGHLRPRFEHERAIARIAAMAVARLEYRIFEQSDMSIPSTCRTRQAHILPGARFAPHNALPPRSLMTPLRGTVAQRSQLHRGSKTPPSHVGASLRRPGPSHSRRPATVTGSR
jgi:hypothetical protein